MTMFRQPISRNVEDTAPSDLQALARLESTANTIRIRIAGLAPDQIYRGTTEDFSIAEMVALAVAREEAYLDAFQRGRAGHAVTLVEPEQPSSFLDRQFHQDLARFFDLRRATLDITQALSYEDWERTVELGGQKLTLGQLAQRLVEHDGQMLDTISRQRQHWLRTSGIDELRDGGVAGKLSPNIGQ